MILDGTLERFCDRNNLNRKTKNLEPIYDFMGDDNHRKFKEIYEKALEGMREIGNEMKQELDKPWDQMDRDKISNLMDKMTELRKKAQDEAGSL